MVATAESCTGGLVAGALTEIAGSSAVVDRGFVTYSNEAKHEMLGVPPTTLNSVRRGEPRDRRGDGARRARHTPMPISRLPITGIAGPGGGSAEKPVGLVHFAAASRSGDLNHRERRFGDIGRAEVRRLSVLRGAAAMLTELAAKPKPVLPPVDLVGARLEGRGEAAERHIEHPAHQHAERAAAKLVVDEELDLAGLLAEPAGRSSGSACG